MKRLGLDCVYLDISHHEADYVRERFPNIYRRCLSFGFDITAEPIPVVPAAHYMCGGVVTDLMGAYGDTAALRRGRNRDDRTARRESARLEFIARSGSDGTTGIRAAREQTRGDNVAPPEFPEWDPGHAIKSEQRVLITQSWDEIRRLMWNYVGIVRSDRRLERALRRIDLLKAEIHSYYWDHLIDSDLIEVRNLVTVAELVVRCAIARKESRGLHYTIDYPDRDDVHWQRNTTIRAGDALAPASAADRA